VKFLAVFVRFLRTQKLDSPCWYQQVSLSCYPGIVSCTVYLGVTISWMQLAGEIRSLLLLLIV